MDAQLEKLLREAVAQEASDIHIKVGVPPYVRIHGVLRTFGSERIQKEYLERIVAEMTDSEGRDYSLKREADFALTIPGLARFRCNLFRQRGSYEMIMRVVPYDIPSIDELGLPPILKHMSLEARGLILVTGVTGSGKSTTIASMVSNINQNLPVHIVTIEDPIEFVYRDEMASITQREVGIDTDTFHDALKYVLRQDPDVIVLGEMRDRETAQTAMTAAETGHLVMSTLHTADSVQTMDRIVDLFPAEQHQQIRHQLAVVLKGIASMRLIPRTDGKGLIPAIEIMMNTPAIKSLIEENKIGEIKSLISEGGAQYGMQTFDQSLLNLYRANLISKESALEEATSRAELEMAMRGITVGTVSTLSFGKSSEMDFYKRRAKEFYGHAVKLYQQGLVEDASREVRRALIDHGDYAEAKELMAKIDQALHREDLHSKIDPFVKKGLDLMNNGKYQEAIAEFNRGLAVSPGDERLTNYIKAAEEKKKVVSDVRPLIEKASSLFQEGKLDEARAAFQDVLAAEPSNNDAMEKMIEITQGIARQNALSDLEILSATAEDTFAQKRWFDAVSCWNLVREIQADNQKAIGRIAEAGAQLKMAGLQGLPPATQAAWVGQVTQAFAKGLDLFIANQVAACLSEWKQAVSLAPQAQQALEPFRIKVEELLAGHVRYHVEKARQFLAANDLGKMMIQVRHILQLDSQAAEAHALYKEQKVAIEQTLQRHLSEGDEWLNQNHFAHALFALERAFELDPAKQGLRAKLMDVRTKFAKHKELMSALDKKKT